MADPYGSPIDPNPVLPPGYQPYPGGPTPYYPSYGPPYGATPPGSAPSAERPGLVLAAAVLGYVEAGLLLLAGLVLLFGAAAASSISSNLGEDVSGPIAEAYLGSAANLVSGGLLLAGALLVSARRDIGRVLFSVGGAVCTVAGIYWLARVQEAQVLPYAVLFTVPTVVAVGLLWAAVVSRWLRGASG